MFGPQARADIGKHSGIHHNLQVVIDGLLYLIISPLYNLWPGLMDYFQTPRLKQILGANYEVKKYIDDSIEEHQKTLGEEEEEPRDFIDAVIIERRKRPFDKSLSAGQIQQTIVDLFGGGKKEKGKKKENYCFGFLEKSDCQEGKKEKDGKPLGRIAETRDK